MGPTLFQRIIFLPHKAFFCSSAYVCYIRDLNSWLHSRLVQFAVLTRRKKMCFPCTVIIQAKGNLLSSANTLCCCKLFFLKEETKVCSFFKNLFFFIIIHDLFFAHFKVIKSFLSKFYTIKLLCAFKLFL